MSDPDISFAHKVQDDLKARIRELEAQLVDTQEAYSADYGSAMRRIERAKAILVDGVELAEYADENGITGLSQLGGYCKAALAAPEGK